jgi:hypothetical protein
MVERRGGCYWQVHRYEALTKIEEQALPARSLATQVWIKVWIDAAPWRATIQGKLADELQWHYHSRGRPDKAIDFGNFRSPTVASLFP